MRVVLRIVLNGGWKKDAQLICGAFIFLTPNLGKTGK